jgi:hypothetical protein
MASDDGRMGGKAWSQRKKIFLPPFHCARLRFLGRSTWLVEHEIQLQVLGSKLALQILRLAMFSINTERCILQSDAW